MRPTALFLCVSLLCGTVGWCASRPGPFRFCYGLDSPGDLPVLKTLGLDTLYLQLDVAESLDLKPVRSRIQQAQQQGLKVIVELPTCLTPSYRVSPYDEKYVGTVRELIQSVVRDLRDEPGLTAWATASMLERRLDFSDADFRAYLQDLSPSLDVLNAHWGSRIPTWPSVAMDDAGKLESRAPYALGPARIDLADYEADAYRRVMELWLEAIRQEDSTRSVLTGRVTLYRSLLSIPNGYDVVCVSMPPDVLENDQEAHNPQALDIARRGGKFSVLPAFRVPMNTSPAYTAGSFRDWVHVAALHGAVGFGIEDWEMLAPLYDLERRSVERGRRLTNAIHDAAGVPCNLVPRATSAVIYSPYASGFDVTRQPVYGYLVDYLVGEPSNLAYDLRLGTRYGVVDYLSVGDLKERELDNYGCLLAPACLNLPPPQAGQLEDYVRRGGVLVADLGLGAYQTGAWTLLPEVLQRAFGVLALVEPRERFGDLTAADATRVLSPWPRGLKAQGLFSPRHGATASATEARKYSVSGWTAEALLTDGAVPLATVSVRFDTEKRALFAGLVGQQYGSGLALFATHPLWQYWPLTDGLSQVLHGQLMGRRAAYELLQSGLLQSGPYFGGGEEAVAVFNPGRQTVLAELRALAARSHAYAGCVSHFSATPGAEGLAPGAATLVTDVPAGETRQMDRTGLTVQPYTGEATVDVSEYGPQQVSFEIAGTGCIVRPMRRGLELQGGEAVSVRMVLTSGAYPVPANSRHVVVVRGGGRQTRAVLTADARGQLDLSDTYGNCTVTVTRE